MAITLNGLSMATDKLNKMVYFYNTVFNANLSPISLGNATYYQGHIGATNLTLAPTDMLGTFIPKSQYQLSFSVSDLEKVVHLAQHAGGIQLQEISTYNTDRYCGITDPDGNTIELIEPL